MIKADSEVAALFSAQACSCIDVEPDFYIAGRVKGVWYIGSSNDLQREKYINKFGTTSNYDDTEFIYLFTKGVLIGVHRDNINHSYYILATV